MGAKVTTKRDDFPKMVKELKTMKGSGIEVGVLKGEDAWLASIHEYGCDIPVTDKMRKYLAYRGLYLRKETTTIHIPERAFLRNGYDSKRDEVLEKAKLLMGEVVAGHMTSRGLCQAVGLSLSSAIKDAARDLRDPPNHPFTIDQKGSSNPLVDTGDMIGGISWRMKK